LTRAADITLTTAKHTVASEQEEREFLRVVGEKLISVREASRMSKLTSSYIRRLLRSQELAGVKIDRDWFTTRGVMQSYLDKDSRPGPKTD